MRPSEHEIRYAELIDSMPTEELGRELVNLTIIHDTSFEAMNTLAEFFKRAEAERCIGEVATASVNENQGKLFRVDI